MPSNIATWAARACRPTSSLSAGWCLQALVVLVVCLFASGVRAETLSNVATQALPVLDVGEPIVGTGSTGDDIVVVTPTRIWRLADPTGPWQPSPLPLEGNAQVLGVVAAAKGETYLRLDAAPAGERLARLVARGGAVQLQALPGLPTGLVDLAVARLGAELVASGVASDGKVRLYALQTQQAGAAWREREPWPGAAPATTLASQSSALYATVPAGSNGLRLLRWAGEGGWQDRGAVPDRLAAGIVRPLGQAHILYRAPTGLVLFHTITGAWVTTPVAGLEGAGHLTPWKDGLVGFRTDATRVEPVYAGFQAGKYLLGWVDWLVIAVYLVLMLGIGLYFYLREKHGSTADFFVGGRSIPFWAAGVSLYATNTSSISFIAIPAKAFESNWQYLTNNLVAVLGLMFVAVKIVPLLRRLDLMSVFSYLETRFHPSIRMLASALAIAMQVGSRMSVILFLPSMAIATITGLDVVWSILIMGGFTIVYTAIGGMKAVIWTDFVQVFVMIGGALFAIGFIVLQLDGGFSEFFSAAATADKTKLLDFSFDLTQATVWGFIFLVVFDVVLTFPKDQVLMQRTLSTSSDREAGRSIWAFAAIMIPGGFMFYTIGTALWVFYRNNPERMNPLLPIDATFPLFIAAELPIGITGLIIAAIFAAAMSTMSSIINSVATLVSVDFYDRLARNPTPQSSVRFAEITTVFTGLVAMGLALLLSRYDIRSLFDVSIELAGLLGGGFAGAYTLGMFTRRANAPGVAIGIFGSIVLTLTAWSADLVHPYFYLAISILLCIVIGYVASLFFPPPAQSLKGLTIYRQDAVARVT